MTCSMLLTRADSEIEVRVTGTYSRGCAPTGPSYASGGDPGEGAGFDDIVATDAQGVEYDLTPDELRHAEELLLARHDPHDVEADECDECECREAYCEPCVDRAVDAAPQMEDK